jgi:hypothetical protein
MVRAAPSKDMPVGASGIGGDVARGESWLTPQVNWVRRVGNLAVDARSLMWAYERALNGS